MKQSIQSDVVILNIGETLTPPLSHTARSFTRLISSPVQLVSLDKGRGSKVKEILNQVQNDNRTMAKKDNNMKTLIDLSTYQPINFNNYSLAHLWERGRVRGANVTLKPSPEFVKFTLVHEQILPSHKERGLKV